MKLPKPPKGYRLATEEDRKRPKPNRTKFRHPLADIWFFANTFEDWDDETIYAVPDDAQDVPPPPPGFVIASDKYKQRFPKTASDLVLHRTKRIWEPVCDWTLGTSWQDGDVYAVSQNPCFEQNIRASSKTPTPRAEWLAKRAQEIASAICERANNREFNDELDALITELSNLNRELASGIL
jgi:hypothetical protein